ncbi:hypothetical protein AAMO2058_000660700 [Amorphochlora amoebiformis]
MYRVVHEDVEINPAAEHKITAIALTYNMFEISVLIALFSGQNQTVIVATLTSHSPRWALLEVNLEYWTPVIRIVFFKISHVLTRVHLMAGPSAALEHPGGQYAFIPSLSITGFWIIALGNLVFSVDWGRGGKEVYLGGRIGYDGQIAPVEYTLPKKVRRRLRRNDAWLKRNPGITKEKDPIPMKLGGKFKKMKKYEYGKYTPEMEWSHIKRKLRGSISLESTDEDTAKIRDQEHEQKLRTGYIYNVGERVVLNITGNWNGMRGIVTKILPNRTYQVQVVHGKTKRRLTSIQTIPDYLISETAMTYQEQTRERRLKRLERRFNHTLTGVKRKAAKHMVAIWRKLSPDKKFKREWYRPVLSFVNSKPKEELGEMLSKIGEFKYKIPPPPGIPGLKRPPAKPLKPMKDGRWDGFVYFPSNEEVGVPEWKVGDKILVDVEKRNYWRKGNVTKIFPDSRGVTHLRVRYQDEQVKGPFPVVKHYDFMADDWKRIYHFKSPYKHVTHMSKAERKIYDSYRNPPKKDNMQDDDDDDDDVAGHVVDDVAGHVANDVSPHMNGYVRREEYEEESLSEWEEDKNEGKTSSKYPDADVDIFGKGEKNRRRLVPEPNAIEEINAEDLADGNLSEFDGD